jgi:PIN domain nuclease of toxin-antitoxin system
VLLDTHIWLWATEGDTRRIGPRTRRAIERARADDELHVTTVSIFEITALQVAGRLDLATSAERWIRESIDASGLRVLDLNAAIAIDAGSIPAAALADPCDRFLVATARHSRFPLITRDARILDYARLARTLRAVDART